MQSLLKKINHKINGVIFTFTSTGVILLILSVLIVWTDFVLRLTVGLLVIVMAYIFFYSGYRIWSLKREIEKHFKL